MFFVLLFLRKTEVNKDRENNKLWIKQYGGRNQPAISIQSEEKNVIKD